MLFQRVLSCGTRGGVPAGRVGKFLEVRCDDQRPREVRGIFNLCGDAEPPVAGRFVFGGIPGISDAAAFSIEVERVVDAFPRRDHAEFPVFDNHRYPVAREIDWSGLLTSTSTGTTASSAATPTLCVKAAGNCQ